jgi:hypothetical protein
MRHAFCSARAFWGGPPGGFRGLAVAHHGGELSATEADRPQAPSGSMCKKL